MKKSSILLAIVVLVLASLACQTLTGGGTEVSPTNIPDVNSNEGSDPTIPTIPTIPPVAPEESSIPPIGTSTDFPLPADAINVISVGNDVVNFQTKLSLDEGLDFYKDQFGKLGYTERNILTVTSETIFSIVFDGHESGKAIVVQGVDLGDGTINISITLSDI